MLKHRSYIIAILILTIILLSGCTVNQTKAANNKNEITFTDDLKNEVKINGIPKKVVSLSGSFTEVWNLSGGSVIGVTSDVKEYRSINVPSDATIVGTIKQPNIEKILSLKPDFVILSADIPSHLEAAKILKKSNINVAFFKVEFFEDYLRMLKTCTSITKREDLYKQNGLDVQKRIEAIISKIDTKKTPSALLIRAYSSGAKAKDDDNMTGAMLHVLGVQNIASKHKSLLEDLSIEKIIEENPDYIFVTTMGNDTEKALNALKKGIEANPAWSNLSAVKNNRYIVLPKDLFHYKPNNRWDEAYEYLAKILYPETFK